MSDAPKQGVVSVATGAIEPIGKTFDGLNMLIKLTIMRLRLWADRILWTLGYRPGGINPWALRVGVIKFDPSKPYGLKQFARARNLQVERPEGAPHP